jgi:hypothetical protein
MWILPKNYQLSSHFVQDMVASKEDLTCAGLNIESSLMSRSKPIALPTWLRRWKPGNYHQHLYLRILKNSQRKSFETELTSLLAATHASRFHQQESDSEQMTPGTCGRISGDTLNQLDLFDASLKTSKDTSRLDSPALSAIWKKMVTEQRGEYLARMKLAHRIREKESTSWATPRAADGVGGANKLNHKGQRITKSDPTKTCGAKLSDQVNWATPNARDWKDSVTTTLKTRKDGKKRNDQLPRQIAQINQKNWTTPTCHMAKEGAYPAEFTRNTISLTAQANWPTPDVAQAQKVSNRPNYGQLGLANHPDVHGTTVQRPPMKKDRLGLPGQDQGNTSGKSQESFGKLNPNWVEQLMGLPIGLTDLGSWGME